MKSYEAPMIKITELKELSILTASEEDTGYGGGGDQTPTVPWF